MPPNLSLETVRAGLALQPPTFDPSAAQLRMAPQPRPMQREGRSGSPRLAAVLILLYPDSAGQLTFALMQRNEYEGVHSGQISLPGGRTEPGETWEQTALRETCEELGACENIEVLGALTPLYVPPSDFEIHPIVGTSPVRPAWSPDSREVAAILEIPLTDLFDPAKKGVGRWTLKSGVLGDVPHYILAERVVWGATAVILSELEGRLSAVTVNNPPSSLASSV